MALLNLIVKGLYLGTGFVGFVAILDVFFPGKLAATVFSDLGIIILFALLMIDTFFNFLLEAD